jgi:hypothetical protein
MSVPSQDFAHQNLRDRSFKGQDLRNANFEGADLRGCNFAGTVLIGANFSGARMGITWQRVLPLLSLAAIAAAPIGHVLSRLLFAAQGQTSEDQAWPLVALLYGVLTAVGVLSGLRAWMGGRSRSGRITGAVVGIFSGVVLGFFYAGTKTGSIRFALGGAATGAIVMLIGSLLPPSAVFEVVLSALGSVATYGAALWIGAMAIAYLSTGHWIGGVVLVALTLLYLWIVVRSLVALIQEIRQSVGTCFRGADLTDAKFDCGPPRFL